jgi:phytoene synthase
MSALLHKGYRRAESIARSRAKSFAFAAIALDRRTRRSAFAVYAFCRRCDDAVDRAVDAEERQRATGRLREELDAVYMGDDLGDPILAAFGDAVRGLGVPKDAFLDLLQGMDQDVWKKRYETWDELLHYCELAAGTVGRMMASVFGVDHPDALVHATALGRAMQLTNVLRDVREDLVEHGRVYLPREALVAAGVTEADVHRFVHERGLDRSSAASGMRTVMADGAARARALYQFAGEGIPRIVSVSGRACVRLMAATYGEILDVLEASGWDCFRGRASTTPTRKALVGARAVVVPLARMPRAHGVRP